MCVLGVKMGGAKFIIRKMKILGNTIQSEGFIAGVKLFFSRILDNTLNSLYYHSLPVDKNRLLFFSTPDYSDNARALYDYMVSKNLDKTYDLIWAVADSKKLKQLRKSGIKCVKQNAIFPSGGMHRLWYYGKTAKYVFHTHGHPFGLERKNGQIVVNLLHGGMGFKGPSKGANYGKTDDYIIMLGNSDDAFGCTMFSLGCPRDVLLPLGLPRNDLLFKYKIVKQIDNQSGCKILWMPTFRESNNTSISSPTLNTETHLPILCTVEELKKFNDVLESLDVHIYIKNHPLRKETTVVDISLSNIHTIDVDELSYEDIQLYEIINHFSAMVSDYSSVTFDYLYLDRPIAYTLDDFEEYKISRGFAMENPLDFMPGHHVYTYDDLIAFISDVVNGIDEFKEERERVRELVGLAEGGKASEMLLDFLGIK